MTGKDPAAAFKLPRNELITLNPGSATALSTLMISPLTRH